MIKVGITGHRNLKEICIPFYREEIHNQLKLLQEQHYEILLYSSLAEGADRLVVEVALALDISFVAVLPMRKDLYLRDFTEQSSIEFNMLLDCAISVIEIPLVMDYTEEDVIQNQDKRSFQYESSGHFISDHCNILIALWDGENTYLRGGTSEIVAYYLAKQNYTLYHLQVSRNNDLTNDMIEFKISEKKREMMNLQEVEKLLEKYHIQTLDELEYYLDIDNTTDECIDDPEETTKNCINAQCYEDVFVPDCRKIIEIYKKYFKNDIDTKQKFIMYLIEQTSKSKSSIANYLSCKSCNKQIEKSINNSLKIPDSDFKKDFCFNLDKKFNYVTVFETEYLSIKQFLVKEHEITKDNYKPTFVQDDKMLTQDEDERLFDLTHVSKDELKLNLSNIDNIAGSNSYKMNLALAAFNRNLIKESDKIVDLLLCEKDFQTNQELLQLKAKILSIQERDKEAIILLNILVKLEKPNIDTETNNLLAASIKRDAFDEFIDYSDKEKLVERFSLSKDIYFSIYKLNNDYYPALNYMYLESMLAYIENKDSEHIKRMRVEFEMIWDNLNHHVNDWWSYISRMEYLILQGEYSEVLLELKNHFDDIDEFKINDFNIISTVRQLKLFSEFCSDKELKKIIAFLNDYSAEN